MTHLNHHNTHKPSRPKHDLSYSQESRHAWANHEETHNHIQSSQQQQQQQQHDHNKEHLIDIENTRSSMSGHEKVAPIQQQQPPQQQQPSQPQEQPLDVPDPWHRAPPTESLSLPLRICQIIFSILLAPFRILTIVLLLFISYVISRIFIIGANIPHKLGDPPLPTWRTNFPRAVIRISCRIALLTFGVFPSRVDKRDDTPQHQKPPRLIISNHIGYIEILMIAATYSPSWVAKSELLNAPILGALAIVSSCLFVDRNSRESRASLLQHIHEHVQNEHYPPVALFPEGTTTFGTCVLQFQKGSFTLGETVQPLAFKAQYRYFNPGWSREPLFHHMALLFSYTYHRLKMVVLPPYTPSPEERSDPILYCSNVQHLIASSIDVPASQLSMYDSPHLKLKKRPVEVVAKVEPEPEPVVEKVVEEPTVYD